MEQAVLPVLPVPRDFKEFAVKLESLDLLALPEVVDREVSPVFLAKMSVILYHLYVSLFYLFASFIDSFSFNDICRVNLEKMVNLDRLVLLDLQALEAYRECPVCLESKATAVSPVWTAPKENLAQVVKREHKV